MNVDDIAKGYGGISEEQRRRLAARVMSDSGMSPEVRDAVLVALRPHEWVDLGGLDAAASDAAVDMPALVVGLRIRPRDRGRRILQEEAMAAVPAELFFRRSASLPPTVNVLRELLSASPCVEGGAVAAPPRDALLPTLAQYRRAMTFGELVGEGIRFQRPILLVPPESLAVCSEAFCEGSRESPWVAQMLVVASPLFAFHDAGSRRLRDPIVPWTTPSEAVAMIHDSPCVAKDLWDVFAVGA